MHAAAAAAAEDLGFSADAAPGVERLAQGLEADGLVLVWAACAERWSIAFQSLLCSWSCMWRNMAAASVNGTHVGVSAESAAAAGGCAASGAGGLAGGDRGLEDAGRATVRVLTLQ